MKCCARLHSASSWFLTLGVRNLRVWGIGRRSRCCWSNKTVLSSCTWPPGHLGLYYLSTVTLMSLSRVGPLKPETLSRPPWGKAKHWCMSQSVSCCHPLGSSCFTMSLTMTGTLAEPIFRCFITLDSNSLQGCPPLNPLPSGPATHYSQAPLFYWGMLCTGECCQEAWQDTCLSQGLPRGLRQWFSMSSPQTTSISISWELVRNANS